MQHLQGDILLANEKNAKFVGRLFALGHGGLHPSPTKTLEVEYEDN